MARDEMLRNNLRNKFDIAIDEIVQANRTRQHDKFALAVILEEIINSINKKASAKEVKEFFSKYGEELQIASTFIAEICEYVGTTENPAAEFIRILDNKADKSELSELTNAVDTMKEELLRKISVCLTRDEAIALIEEMSVTEDAMERVMLVYDADDDIDDSEKINNVFDGGILFRVVSSD